MARHNAEIARLNKDVYVTDSLQAMVNNLANAFGGATMRYRYAELIDVVKKDTRTEEEVKNSITEKLRAFS